MNRWTKLFIGFFMLISLLSLSQVSPQKVFAEGLSLTSAGPYISPATIPGAITAAQAGECYVITLYDNGTRKPVPTSDVNVCDSSSNYKNPYLSFKVLKAGDSPFVLLKLPAGSYTLTACRAVPNSSCFTVGSSISFSVIQGNISPQVTLGPPTTVALGTPDVPFVIHTIPLPSKTTTYTINMGSGMASIQFSVTPQGGGCNISNPPATGTFAAAWTTDSPACKSDPMGGLMFSSHINTNYLNFTPGTSQYTYHIDVNSESFSGAADLTVTSNNLAISFDPASPFYEDQSVNIKATGCKPNSSVYFQWWRNPDTKTKACIQNLKANASGCGSSDSDQELTGKDGGAEFSKDNFGSNVNGGGTENYIMRAYCEATQETITTDFAVKDTTDDNETITFPATIAANTAITPIKTDKFHPGTCYFYKVKGSDGTYYYPKQDGPILDCGAESTGLIPTDIVKTEPNIYKASKGWSPSGATAIDSTYATNKQGAVNTGLSNGAYTLELYKITAAAIHGNVITHIKDFNFCVGDDPSCQSSNACSTKEQIKAVCNSSLHDLTPATTCSGGMQCDDSSSLCRTDPNDPTTTTSTSDIQCQSDTIKPTPIPPFPPCAEVLADKHDKNCTAIATPLGQISTDPAQFINTLFTILLSLSGGVSLLLIIISGYQLMVSQGNPEVIKAARERLTSAFVGVLFLIFSLVILQVIGVDILNLPGFGK